MGFLERETSLGAWIAGRGAVFVILAASLAACQGLSLGTPLADGADAWGTEGGAGTRAFVHDAALALPLEQKWVYNAEAAFGPAAALARDGRLFVATRKGEVRVLDLADERDVVGIAGVADAIDGAPVLTDRTLYVPVAAGGHGVVAYDFVRGRTRWKLKAEPHTAGLLLAGDRLVAASLDGVVRAIDAESGEVRWSHAPDSARAVHASPVLLDTGTAAVVDDRGRVTAYALADGAPQWSAELDAPVYATPTASGAQLFVATTRGRLVALDARTGRPRWTYTAATPRTRLTSPATDGRTIFVGGSDGTVAALDAASGEVRWTHSEDGVVAAAPHVAGDAVFVGTLRKRVLALDAATGVVRWQTDIEGRVKTSPLVAGGYLAVLAEPRQVYLFGPAAPDTLAARP